MEDFFIISQCSRQETNILSPEGLSMSNKNLIGKEQRSLNKFLETQSQIGMW